MRVDLSKQLKKQVETAVEVHTQAAVTKAIEPVQAELHVLTTRAKKLEMAAPESKSPKKNDPADPAPRRVTFRNLPDSSAKEWLAAMRAYCAKYPEHAPLAVGNDYHGPCNQRELKKTGYAEFADRDAAREFLKAAGGECEMLGKKVDVKAAKTKFFRQRDWALGKAKEVLEKTKGGKDATADWKSRVVKVGSTVAFEQEADEAAGHFCGKFAHLSLP